MCPQYVGFHHIIRDYPFARQTLDSLSTTASEASNLSVWSKNIYIYYCFFKIILTFTCLFIFFLLLYVQCYPSWLAMLYLLQVATARGHKNKELCKEGHHIASGTITPPFLVCSLFLDGELVQSPLDHFCQLQAALQIIHVLKLLSFAYFYLMLNPDFQSHIISSPTPPLCCVNFELASEIKRRGPQRSD